MSMRIREGWREVLNESGNVKRHSFNVGKNGLAAFSYCRISLLIGNDFDAMDLPGSRSDFCACPFAEGLCRDRIFFATQND